MEITIVGPHIMSIWKTTKKKNEEKGKSLYLRGVYFLADSKQTDGQRMDGRKRAPNLILIPFCHKIETLTHLGINAKKNSSNGKEA